MRIEVWCRTDKGLKRESNQDSYLINEVIGLYIVADGMGGHKGGEIASQMAVVTAQRVIEENLHSPHIKPRDLIQKAYLEASRSIFQKANVEQPELSGMGTTMVLGLAYKNIFYVGNVGDSRAYLYRRPYLWQITEDHSLQNEQLRAGIDPGKSPIARNIITRSVGFEQDVVADVLERPFQENDCYLFCSDGLSSLVSDQEINQILNQTTPDKVTDALIEAALNAGGNDNVTVMFLALKD